MSECRGGMPRQELEEDEEVDQAEGEEEGKRKKGEKK